MKDEQIKNFFKKCNNALIYLETAYYNPTCNLIKQYSIVSSVLFFGLMFTLIFAMFSKIHQDKKEIIQQESMIQFEITNKDESMVENAGKAVGEASVNAAKGIGKGIWKGIVGESKPEGEDVK
jgi:choline-glycine betaine transporter